MKMNRLFLPLAFLLICAFALAFGCATTLPPPAATQATQPAAENPITPYAKAAQGLRITRLTIITAGRSVDALCTQGALKQDVCTQARDAYKKADAGCEAVKTGILLWLDTGYPDEYTTAADNLAKLTSQLTGLIKPARGAN